MNEMKGNARKVFSVVWKYNIKQENSSVFEFEYGSQGTWSKLFAKSRYYRGSFLYKSNEEPGTYLLIDTWKDEESYEDFKKMNKEIYDRLSSQFEYLYKTEEKTGSFYSL